jgi:NTE family protein
LTVAQSITPAFLPDKVRQVVSSTYAAMWGIPNLFQRSWLFPYTNYYALFTLPHMYDLAPLKETLSKFIDFTKLSDPNRPRLIMTSTDIQNSESVTFDSKHMNIDAEHVVACASFPFYGISWTHKDGRYLWDGSLQSNTPLREVIHASPKFDKKVYIINVFAHNQKQLPQNLLETWHRARDIIYADKTDHNLRMSKIISRYLCRLNEMHQFIITNSNVAKNKLAENRKEKLREIKREYNKLTVQRGAIISDIYADFSISTIRLLINRGENDSEKVLRKAIFVFNGLDSL